MTPEQHTTALQRRNLGLLVAALAGLVSFASPCVIPLVPGYLGYVTGLSDVALEERSRGRMIAVSQAALEPRAPRWPPARGATR